MHTQSKEEKKSRSGCNERGEKLISLWSLTFSSIVSCGCCCCLQQWLIIDSRNNKSGMKNFSHNEINYWPALSSHNIIQLESSNYLKPNINKSRRELQFRFISNSLWAFSNIVNDCVCIRRSQIQIFARLELSFILS